MSRDRHVDAPAATQIIACNLFGLILNQAIQERAAQPLRIIPAQAECLAEDARLMPSARMRRTKAVVLDLT